MAAKNSPRQPKNLSEERLKSVLQLSSDWYWEQDKDLRFTLFSGKNFGQAGFEPASLIGRTRWEIPGARFELDERATVQAKLDAREPFFDHEYERVGPDGLARTISASGVPILDASGRFAGYRGIAKDITERKRAEELQSLEHSVAHQIAAAEGVTAAMTAVIRAICETQSWECGRYLRVDEEAGALRLGESWGVEEPAIQQYIERSGQRSREIVYRPGVGLIGQVWQSGQPLWVADVTKDARVLQTAFAVDVGIRGGFVFPVISEGKTIGVLAFNSRQVREPDERLLKAILAIGSQIGQFLERKRAEEEQRRFRAAMDASADLMLLVDPTRLRYVDVNDAACRALGYSREELLTMGPPDIFSTSREELARLYERMIAGELIAPIVKGLYRRKDGSQLPIEAYPRAVRSGEGHVIVSIARDIRERLVAEEAQREQAALIALSAEKDRLLRLFYELPFVGLAVTSPGSKRWLQVNDYMCEMLGYPREELLELAWTETTHPDDLAANLALFQRLTAGEFDSFQFDKRFLRKDGGIVDTTMEVRCVRRGDGSVETVVIMVRDITERKRAEQLRSLEHAVNRSLAEADSAAGALKAAIRAVCETEGWECGRYFSVDEEAGALRVDESWGVPELAIQQFLERSNQRSHEVVYKPGVGLMGQVWQSGQPLWVADVTKDDRALRAAFAVDIGIRGGFVFPVISEGKTIGVLAFNSREVRHPEERLLQAIHVIGGQIGQFLQRKRAEEEQRRFRVALDNSADMIVLIDRTTMRFVDVNETACRLLGYSREELLKMGPQDVLPASREELEHAYDEFIANPSHIHGMRSHYRCRDGSTFPFESTRHVLRSGDAHIIAAISRDIRERLAAETALRESEERFRSLTELSTDTYWEQDEQFRFTSMSGTSSERVNARSFTTIGKKRWEQNYINMNADQWAEHIAALEAHKPFRDMELCRLDETGKNVWISISGEPVFDASGAFNGYRGVGKDITERKRAEERIQHLASHDALTSLPNRVMFGEVLNIAIQNAQRYNRRFAVLFIDLDRFKIINDTLGHEAGDKLLKEMGTRLSETVRSSDVVARLGGDEFVVLVQEVSEPKQMETVARKILSALAKPMLIQGQECGVTASIGICMYPSDAQEEQSLMKNADIAMYRAKEEGKNTYKFYSEEINVHSFERMALETSLRRGLERNEFFLHYQAKLDLRTKQITGVEALVRWQHPELGVVPPMQFIPLAEETGLIVPIGKWVLNRACAQNVAWQREGLPPLRMAVNLSARQFADDDLLEDIGTALRESGMKPELLELELTESMVMQNADRASTVLAAIKRLGVRIAIDDFGVGYSSLTHLKRFPIDTLKVDRSFIRDIPQDPGDRAITEAIIAMGKSLKLTVVAEGVETQEQQTFLYDHNCDEMQGFFFSKPVASDQFVELLRERIGSSKQ
jgi:diguanylate cyclase (GGDEF)-like protein/PAS domain S-box-containing protein